MSTLSEDVLDLFDDLYLVAGVSLSVTRGVDPPVVIEAIKGRRFTERFGDENVYGSSTPSDFIVKQKTWRDTFGTDPNTNDYLQWTDDNGEVHRSQIAVDDRERHYDEVDQFGRLWRLHSVEQ